jgi:uncharacterized protein
MIEESTYALITGASSGIGRAIAEELAKRGISMVLTSLPGEELGSFAETIERKYGVQTYFFEKDLSESDGPQSVYDYCYSKGLRVSILINNAGIGFEGRIEEYESEDIDMMISLNIRAVTHLTRLFMPVLRLSKRSYILFAGSFGSYIPVAIKSIYLATKSYIFYFARSLQSELKGSNVVVSVLVPSGVITNKRTIERIERSGAVSRIAALTPEHTARTGIRQMFRGRKIIIPGKLTNIIFAIGAFLPMGLMIIATSGLFKKPK